MTRCEIITSGDPQDLVKQLNEFLSKGWKLQGNMLIWHSNEIDWFCQMIYVELSSC